jgi:alkaline phosphatase D
MPLRASTLSRDGALRLYRLVRYGKLATFTMLDCRQYRSEQPCGTPTSRRGRIAGAACGQRADPNRSMLGAAQEQWLFESFKRADTAWNIIGQTQLIAQLQHRDFSGEMMQWTGGWDGYPASRQRMLDALKAARVSNPVFAGGDFHSFWAADLKADFNDPSSAIVATEFLTSSITSNPPDAALIRFVLPANPHIRYFESRHRGYTAVALTADRMEARFEMISDRRNRDASLSTLKRFAVESGKPGAIPA